jgi:hypothetical protein
VKKWCDQHKLDLEICSTLQEDGFNSLDMLKLLTEDEVSETYQLPKRLKLAQCLALKNALRQLHTPTSVEAACLGESVLICT